MWAPNIDPNHPAFKDVPKCLCVQSDQDVDCPLHGSIAREKAAKKAQTKIKKSKTKNLVKALTTLCAADKAKAFKIVFESLTDKQLIKMANLLIKKMPE